MTYKFPRASALALLLALSAVQASAQAAAQSRDPSAAERIHRAALVIDAHADLPAPYDFGASWPAADAADQVAPALLSAGAVDAVFLSVFVPQGENSPERIAAARQEAEAKLAFINRRIAAEPARLRLARSADEIEQIATQGRTAVLIGLLNAYPLGSAADLSAFYREGVRVVGFTHAGHNQFADSSRPQPRDSGRSIGGLSAEGKALVGEANCLGVLLDVSQLSTPAFLEAVALSRAPVIASHSGVRSVVNSARNLSDAELDALKAKGGVVSIVAFSSYLKPVPAENQARIAAVRARYGAVNGYEGLSAERRAALSAEIRALTPQADVGDLVASIDYAVRRIGIDHVAISSDFNHGGGVEGWRDASQTSAVTRALLERGFSETDIAKLWGGNVLRVLRAAEQAAPARVALAR
jgi:membrane dipeptidase